MEEGERGGDGREGAANLRGREVFERELDTEGTAEILLRECRKGEKTYGQSTRHESEVRLRNGQKGGDGIQADVSE